MTGRFANVHCVCANKLLFVKTRRPFEEVSDSLLIHLAVVCFMMFSIIKLKLKGLKQSAHVFYGLFNSVTSMGFTLIPFFSYRHKRIHFRISEGQNGTLSWVKCVFIVI